MRELGTPPSTRSQPVIGPSRSQTVSALGKYPPHQEPSAAVFLIHKHAHRTLSRPFLSFYTLDTIATSCLPEHREPTSRPVPSASTANVSVCPPTCTVHPLHPWPNTVLVHHPSCASRPLAILLLVHVGTPALAHSLPLLSAYSVVLGAAISRRSSPKSVIAINSLYPGK